MKFSVSHFLVFSCSVPAANGFAFVMPRAPRSSNGKTSSARFMADAPSDTSSDDTFISVESQTYNPTESEALVSSVLDQLPTALAEVTSETRTAINEALLSLEALNPSENPTMSPLLNGVWELRYAAGYSPDWALPSPTRQLALFLYSGGYSPGLFALSLAQQLPSGLVDVGDLEISISREQPRIEAKVSVKLLNGSLENQVVVRARIDVESSIRLKETYESATVLDNKIALPSQLQYSRELYVTYVDDDLLVVRDASGVPEVLVRKTKSFQQNWGTEPSALDDMGPPGEDLSPSDY